MFDKFCYCDALVNRLCVYFLHSVLAIVSVVNYENMANIIQR